MNKRLLEIKRCVSKRLWRALESVDVRECDKWFNNGGIEPYLTHKEGRDIKMIKLVYEYFAIKGQLVEQLNIPVCSAFIPPDKKE